VKPSKSKKQRNVARVRRGKTTAANLEDRFDAGEDVSDYFDTSKTKRRYPAYSIAALKRNFETALRDVNRRGLVRVLRRGKFVAVLVKPSFYRAMTGQATPAKNKPRK
jgi:predicted RNA-binding Zn ribbon-like protein